MAMFTQKKIKNKKIPTASIFGFYSFTSPIRVRDGDDLSNTIICLFRVACMQLHIREKSKLR